jgi:Zn-dependent protease/predicted transcriptional regulator
VLVQFYPEWSVPHRWIGGAFVAAVFFGSVLAHEMSHAIVSNRNGLPVKSITLFVFGGVANLTKEPDQPGLEFRIAIVGPLTSLALGGVFAALWLALRGVNEGVSGICAELALINTSLAVFNMLPGFPLDGGRVFRSAVWKRNHDRLRATRTAARVGEGIAYGIMALGLALTLVNTFSGIWLLLIGFFLRNASAGSYEQLAVETAIGGVTAAEVMSTVFDRVPPDMSVDELVQERMLQHHARCYAVMAGGDFAGLVTLADVRKIPREQWATTSVYRAMTPTSALKTVWPSETLPNVLRIMATGNVNQLPVIQGRELVGMISRADVVEYIQLRRTLDSDTPAS